MTVTKFDITAALREHQERVGDLRRRRGEIGAKLQQAIVQRDKLTVQIRDIRADAEIAGREADVADLEKALAIAVRDAGRREQFVHAPPGQANEGQVTNRLREGGAGVLEVAIVKLDDQIAAAELERDELIDAHRSELDALAHAASAAERAALEKALKGIDIFLAQRAKSESAWRLAQHGIERDPDDDPLAPQLVGNFRSDATMPWRSVRDLVRLDVEGVRIKALDERYNPVALLRDLRSKLAGRTCLPAAFVVEDKGNGLPGSYADAATLLSVPLSRERLVLTANQATIAIDDRGFARWHRERDLDAEEIEQARTDRLRPRPGYEPIVVPETRDGQDVSRRNGVELDPPEGDDPYVFFA